MEDTESTIEAQPIECTYESALDDEHICLKIWHCCDCGREMRHRLGDIFARCDDCTARQLQGV